MAIQILGAYATEQEAITAVEVHALAGLRADNITLFANPAHVKSLENQTQVTVKADQPMEEDDETNDGLIGKVKNIFSNDEDFDLHSEEHLMEFGLTNTEAAECLQDVKSGKIVVLADDDMRMGHGEDVIGT